jgi:hypothetical protein
MEIPRVSIQEYISFCQQKKNITTTETNIFRISVNNPNFRETYQNVNQKDYEVEK